MESKLKIDDILNQRVRLLDDYPAGLTFEEVALKYGFKESEIIRLAGNESTLGVSPNVIEAVEQAIVKSNYYSEPKSDSLLKALEDKFKCDELNMDKLGVVVGNGLDNVMEHLAQLFLNDKSSIIDTPPTFVYYQFMSKKIAGAEVIEVPRNKNFEIDAEKIMAAVKENTKIVFICSPNNPTGNLTDIQTVEYLAKSLLPKNVILFVDHAYIEFTEMDKPGRETDAKYLIEKYPNIIAGYTFSKAYAMAGFRVGYALMSREILRHYFKIITPFVCTRPSVAAAIAALNDEAHLKKIIVNNRMGKDFLYKEFEKLEMDFYKTDANFILLRHRKLTAPELVEALLKKAIIIRPIKHVDRLTVRVTIGTAHENKRLVEALKAVELE